MVQRKIMAVAALLILAVVSLAYDLHRPAGSLAVSDARRYHDDVLVRNNLLLLEKDGTWETSSESAFHALLNASLTGQIVDRDAHSVPSSAIPIRLIAEGEWNALCYYDPSDGALYLSRIMEGMDDLSFTVLRLSSGARRSLDFLLK